MVPEKPLGQSFDELRHDLKGSSATRKPCSKEDSMSIRNAAVDELERQAAEQRRRVSRDVAALRRDLRWELDLRGHLEDGIHARPSAFYGGAAATALFAGYVLARILKA